jgi:O-antigen ligase
MSDAMTSTSPMTRSPLVELAGIFGLYATAFFARLVPSLAYVGLTVMVLAFLLQLPRIWPQLRRDALFRLVALFTLYLVLLTGWSVVKFPDIAALQVSDAWSLLQTWFFLMAAWWFGRRQDRMLLALLLALTGLVIKTVYVLDPEQLAAIFHGARSGFGMSHISFSLYSATAILGLLVLAPRIWGSMQQRGRFALRLTLWTLCLVLMIEGLIATQSRITWIACVLVFVPVLVIHLRNWLRAHPTLPRSRIAMVGLLMLVISGGLLLVNADTLRHRLQVERDTAAAILALDLKRIPTDRESSLGVRFHLYQYGFNKWRERPLFGWGPGATKPLIDLQQQKELRDWPHLHNTYLEILLRLGLVGAAFYLAGAWLLLRALLRAHRSGTLAPDLALYLYGVFALTAIWSITDFRMIHADWLFYSLLFGGIAYGNTLSGDEP